jgi:hypothetical protein
MSSVNENVVAEIQVSPPAKAKPRAPGVRVDSPQISVVLRKVVNRKTTIAAGVESAPRVKESEGRHIDLTPYLGEGSTVMVRRSTHGTSSGDFAVQFPDQLHPTLQDSIYGLVEPMDIIEIRMARDVSATGSAATDRTRMPIIIRGFVSEIMRSEVMGEHGPERHVTISGHDYSKALAVISFIFLPTMTVGQDLLTSFRLFYKYSVEANGDEPASAFIERCITGVANPWLAKMQAGSGGTWSPVQQLQVDATSVDAHWAVQPIGVQQIDNMSLLEMMNLFGDVGPWNELYVEDREDGPWVVYRPAPFKTAAGDYIQEGVEADRVRVTAHDLMGMEVRRADSDVSNYFWVGSPMANMIENPLVQQSQSLEPSPNLTGYQNADPAFFGIRLMQVDTNQGPRYDGKAAAEVAAGEALMLERINEKRRILIEGNKDNVVLERGSMRLKGNEKIKAGTYISLDRGGFVAEFYAHTVTQEFVVGRGFVTSVEFDRGTGFVQRLTKNVGASPYISELTIRGAYG